MYKEISVLNGDFKLFLVKYSLTRINIVFLVQKEGLEPSRDFSHMPLKHACLPIPALLHKYKVKKSL